MQPSGYFDRNGKPIAVEDMCKPGTVLYVPRMVEGKPALVSAYDAFVLDCDEAHRKELEQSSVYTRDAD